MTTEIEDLRLQWPADLFVAEASELLSSGYATDVNAVKLLFGEAFAERIGARLVEEMCENGSVYRGKWKPKASIPLGVWDMTETDGFRPSGLRSMCESLLEEVLRRAEAGKIPEFITKQYWSSRQQGVLISKELTMEELRAEFVDLVGEFDQAGYLDIAAGANCCDYSGDREDDGAAAITRRWGRAAVWPTASQGRNWIMGLEDDDFLDLLEVFFDLVYRPRRSYWHSFCDEWDYSDHHARSGQRIYVWRVNALLCQSKLDLRLSDYGEDAGRLVRVVRDERAGLVHMVASSTVDPQERARIEHAASLQRTRKPTRETKRAAARALADVLENRREKAREKLGKKDERDLFEIINRFDIRHMNSTQQADYGEEFTDYFYWTFLSSIALLDRLEERTPTLDN